MKKIKLEEVKPYVKEVSLRLGNLLKTTREAKKMSMRELSRLSGVCIASISDIENGNKLPRMLLVLRMAIVLEIPIEDIFGEKII